MASTVLVVDDEKNIRRTLRMVLESEGFQVDEAEDAEAGLARIEEGDIDVVILDVRLPNMSGLEALKQIKSSKTSADIPVIMVSGHASVAEAVEAVQVGAIDFFEKPLDRDRVVISVRNAARTLGLTREVKRLRADNSSRFEMVGESEVMAKLFSEIEKVAPTTGRVLITGESGTGKELVARAVHRLSQRVDAPFIKVNCAAIPAELIESELFGHERGAFTGATARKKGMFELADKGTLFLDEIGDMTPSAQAKVLRALQSGEISRVGAESTTAVDVRVLAATNRRLEQAVEEGTFREDLYYRLDVVRLVTPTLRERPEDIPLLAKAFLAQFCKENGFRLKPVEPGVMERLSAHPFPGNVRQLKNVVERMAILSGDTITLADVPTETRRPSTAPSAERSAGGIEPESEGMTLREYREASEKRFILSALDAASWNISKAAQSLGLERTNLHKKMKAYGIRREDRE